MFGVNKERDVMEIEFVPEQQSRVIDQFKINALNLKILNEFSEYPGKKFQCYLLGNGSEVQSFVPNEPKSDKSAGIPTLFFEIYKTIERRS